MNIIEVYAKLPRKQLGLTFVDTEKVFDNVNWEFLIAMLEEMEFGNSFVNAIKGIYNDQKSYLDINNERSKGFTLGKGTRQGCPLLPLLF